MRITLIDLGGPIQDPWASVERFNPSSVRFVNMGRNWVDVTGVLVEDVGTYGLKSFVLVPGDSVMVTLPSRWKATSVDGVWRTAG